MKRKNIPFTHAGRTLWFTEGTPEEVQRILCELCHTEKRIRLFLGGPKTGEVWPEEYDVLGHIGCSRGPVKVPILLRNARSRAGGAILTRCVLGIDRAPGQARYRHPTFNLGAWRVERVNRGPWKVLHNGTENAAFKTVEQADRYRLFMLGERWAK